MKTTKVIGTILQTLARLVLYGFLLFLALVVVLAFWPSLLGGTRSRHIDQQKHFAKMYSAGDTNAPLLAMDWFYEYGNYFCRVSQSGNVRSARDVGHAIQGGSGISSRFALDSTNRPLFEAAINALPASSKKSLPKERQIWVSGIRSNQWFQFVYDRANIPLEVEGLYNLTGAYLEWFIPRVGWGSGGVQHSTAQPSPTSFCIANDAPIAVSTAVSFGMKIWDLDGRHPSMIEELKTIPSHGIYDPSYIWDVATISPDGQIIVFETHGVLYATVWKNLKLVWQNSPLNWGNIHNLGSGTIAIGNHGQSLFVAGGNSVERWNLADGTKLGTLATNNAGIKFINTSWNGGLLVVCFGDNSFTVWKTDKDEPVYHFTELSGADCMAISPDGQKIVLNAFGQKKLVVYDWQYGERKEFPLRTPYAASSAYSLCWSPDGKWLAADIDTYPSSLVIYDTILWKPIAAWPCGAVGSGSLYGFNKNSMLFQLMDGVISSLDVTKLKPLGD